MLGCTLDAVAKLSSVPGWVRPPLRAVADIEHYLLRLYGSTNSPQALAGFSSLSWLGGSEGEETPGPLVWRSRPTVAVADGCISVATALADGDPYPSRAWWEREAPALGQMSPGPWDEYSVPVMQRYYAHGVVCALGWARGIFDDPALLAPIHRGDGSTVTYSEREEWRVRLRGFAIPDGLPREQLRAWLTDGPAGISHDGRLAAGHGRVAGA